MAKRIPAYERFFDKVGKCPHSQSAVADSSSCDCCWEWTGSKGHRDGYGRIAMPGKSPQLAHRVAYELLVGPIPDGLTIDHLCRNRGCVNPAHLEAVTMAENLRRAYAAIIHCPQGHEYTPENSYIWRGQRRCRICIAAHQRRMRAQRIAKGASRAH